MLCSPREPRLKPLMLYILIKISFCNLLTRQQNFEDSLAKKVLRNLLGDLVSDCCLLSKLENPTRGLIFSVYWGEQRLLAWVHIRIIFAAYQNCWRFGLIPRNYLIGLRWGLGINNFKAPQVIPVCVQGWGPLPRPCHCSASWYLQLFSVHLMVSRGLLQLLLVTTPISPRGTIPFFSCNEAIVWSPSFEFHLYFSIGPNSGRDAMNFHSQTQQRGSD